MKNKLIVITGTNASGKSGLGVVLAKQYNGEIVSADSRQVFKGLDLGSGKIMPDEMDGIAHHLLDVAKPNDFYSLVDFQQMAYAAIDDIHSRKKQPFLVGGTGLYINSVADGYNMRHDKPDLALRQKLDAKTIEELTEIIREKAPEMLERVDMKNKQRLERAAEKALIGDTQIRENSPRYDTLVLGVTWPRDVLYERIRERLDRRLAQDMIGEVVKLRENGATDEFLFKLGLEYRYILMFLRGEFATYEAFYNKLFMEIRHLAKEQMTWFRKRKDIHWIDMTGNPAAEAGAYIDAFLKE